MLISDSPDVEVSTKSFLLENLNDKLSLVRNFHALVSLTSNAQPRLCSKELISTNDRDTILSRT